MSKRIYTAKGVDPLVIPEGSDWHLADALYRNGDSAMLEKLLMSKEPIPSYIRPLLAEIASGTLKIDRRGKSNAQLTYEQKCHIWSTVKGWRSSLKRDDLVHIANEITNDPEGGYVDAGDLRKIINNQNAQIIILLAETYGVSRDVIIQTAKRFKPVTGRGRNKKGQ
jgi:hypothetical protein